MKIKATLVMGILVVVVSLGGMGGRFNSYFQKYYTPLAKKMSESTQEAIARYGPQLRSYAQEKGSKLAERAHALRRYGAEQTGLYGPRIKSSVESAKETALGAGQYVAERAPVWKEKVVEMYPKVSTPVRSWWDNFTSRIASYWSPASRQPSASMVRPIEIPTQPIDRPIEPSVDYLSKRLNWIKAEMADAKQRGELRTQEQITKKFAEFKKAFDNANLEKELNARKLDAELRQAEERLSATYE